MPTSLHLHVLGSAGFHDNDFRKTTCLMIPELGLIFDAGTAFYRVRTLLDLVPPGFDLHVLLSHPHIDHTIGLTYGPHVFYNTNRRMIVHAIKDHDDVISGDLFAKGLFPLARDHQTVRCQSERHDPFLGNDPSFCANGVRIEMQRLMHPGTSIGYRLHLPNGKDFAFVTDTSASLVPRPFVEGVDTLVHECNFPDAFADIARLSGHSYASEVFQLARDAHVKRLMLVHFNPLPEMEVGHAIEDLTFHDTHVELPFELVLSHDTTVVEL